MTYVMHHHKNRAPRVGFAGDWSRIGDGRWCWRNRDRNWRQRVVKQWIFKQSIDVFHNNGIRVEVHDPFVLYQPEELQFDPRPGKLIHRVVQLQFFCVRGVRKAMWLVQTRGINNTFLASNQDNSPFISTNFNGKPFAILACINCRLALLDTSFMTTNYSARETSHIQFVPYLIGIYHTQGHGGVYIVIDIRNHQTT